MSELGKSVGIFSDVIGGIKNIDKVTLSNVICGPDAAHVIANIIASYPRRRYLHLSKNLLGPTLIWRKLF